MRRSIRPRDLVADDGPIRTFQTVFDFSANLCRNGITCAQYDIEAADQYDISWYHRLRAWRYGFTSRSYVWYRLHQCDPTEYLNDIQYRRHVKNANRGYNDVLQNKYAFHLAAQEHADVLPTIHGIIRNGTYEPFNSDYTDLFAALNAEDTLFLKPFQGKGGTGAFTLRATDDNYLLDGEKRSRDAVKQRLADLDEYLVSEYVEQHDYAARIFPDTANTIRIITIIDPETNEPAVVRAAHRFGTMASIPTDNWATAGLAAPVDTETGTLRKAVYLHADSGLERRTTHPNTGAQITGVSIPEWDTVTQMIVDVATVFKGAPYIGWDVTLTADGPVIIEPNAKTGKNIIQLNKGLFADDRFQRFYESIT